MIDRRNLIKGTLAGAMATGAALTLSARLAASPAAGSPRDRMLLAMADESAFAVPAA